MRDFPMFTTENGVASLVFREVPYRGIAYITIRSSESPEALLKECCDFAAAIGAEKIFASGHDCLRDFPFHTAIYALAADKDRILPGSAAMFPVTEDTLERFRQIYNQKMEAVPNSAYMTLAFAKEMLQKGQGYFVHRNGELLGIGMLDGNEIKALASCRRGQGAEVLRTLCQGIFDNTVCLECASENKKAMALYEQEGFIKQKDLSRWYRVK